MSFAAPFNICASGKDFADLSEALKDASNLTYGWYQVGVTETQGQIQITRKLSHSAGTPNTEPEEI